MAFQTKQAFRPAVNTKTGLTRVWLGAAEMAQSKKNPENEYMKFVFQAKSAIKNGSPGRVMVMPGDALDEAYPENSRLGRLLTALGFDFSPYAPQETIDESGDAVDDVPTEVDEDGDEVAVSNRETLDADLDTFLQNLIDEQVKFRAKLTQDKDGYWNIDISTLILE